MKLVLLLLLVAIFTTTSIVCAQQEESAMVTIRSVSRVTTTTHTHHMLKQFRTIKEKVKATLNKIQPPPPAAAANDGGMHVLSGSSSSSSSSSLDLGDLCSNATILDAIRTEFACMWPMVESLCNPDCRELFTEMFKTTDSEEGAEDLSIPPWLDTYCGSEHAWACIEDLINGISGLASCFGGSSGDDDEEGLSEESMNMFRESMEFMCTKHPDGRYCMKVFDDVEHTYDMNNATITLLSNLTAVQCDALSDLGCCLGSILKLMKRLNVTEGLEVVDHAMSPEQCDLAPPPCRRYTQELLVIQSRWYLYGFDYAAYESQLTPAQKLKFRRALQESVATSTRNECNNQCDWLRTEYVMIREMKSGSIVLDYTAYNPDDAEKTKLAFAATQTATQKGTADFSAAVAVDASVAPGGAQSVGVDPSKSSSSLVLEGPPSKSSGLSVGAIVGIVFGVLFGVAIIGALVWFIGFRSKRRSQVQGTLNRMGGGSEAEDTSSARQLPHTTTGATAPPSYYQPKQQPAVATTTTSEMVALPATTWTRHVDDGGREYYHNNETGVTQWERPTQW